MSHSVSFERSVVVFNCFPNCADTLGREIQGALLLCVVKKCCNRGACFIGFDLMFVDDGISRVCCHFGVFA